jgi:hypothetical protein
MTLTLAPKQNYPPLPNFAPPKPEPPARRRLDGDILNQRAAEGFDVLSSSDRKTVKSFVEKWKSFWDAEVKLFTRQQAGQEYQNRQANQWRKIYELGEEFAAATAQTLEMVQAEFEARRQLAADSRRRLEAEFAKFASPIRQKFLKVAKAELAEMDAQAEAEAERFDCEKVERPKARVLRSLIARVERLEQSDSMATTPTNALPWLNLEKI